MRASGLRDPNTLDIKPDKLVLVLREHSQAIRELADEISKSAITPAPRSYSLEDIRRALQTGGQTPLTVTGLFGKLADAQIAGLVVAASLPDPKQYNEGTLLVVSGTPDVFYYLKLDTSANHNWQSISTAPTNMVTTNTVQTIGPGATKTVSDMWTFLAGAAFDVTRGGSLQINRSTELITLSTIGATTDSSANLLPAFSLILGVYIIIDTAVTGPTASLSIGDAVTPARFFTGFAPLTALTSSVGLEQWDGSEVTLAGGPTQYVAAKVRITAVGGNPTAGKVQITTVYAKFIPQTS
jgi:hypothetical protein